LRWPQAPLLTHIGIEAKYAARAGCKLDGKPWAQAKAACQFQPNDSPQTILAPKGRWCNSDQFSKHAVQLGCTAKSRRERHVGNR